MLQGRAVYVPRHGLPECVRSVRFVNRSLGRPRSNGWPADEDQADQATTIELWPGNYYGDLDGKMIARQTARDRAEFVFAEATAPRVEPERSMVVLLANPPRLWEVEFDSAVAASSERTGTFRVIIDNFGTAWEGVVDVVNAPQDAPAAALQPSLTHVV